MQNAYAPNGTQFNAMMAAVDSYSLPAFNVAYDKNCELSVADEMNAEKYQEYYC